MKIKFYENDLPENLDLGNIVAIDTETMGLNPARDRLCLVQLSSGNGICHLLKDNGLFIFEAPYLLDLIENLEYDTIYHEHLAYLSVKPIKYLVEQFGMEIINLENTIIQ